MPSAAAPSATTSFWNQVEQTESTYTPDAPVILFDKKFAEKAQELQFTVFEKCTGAHPLSEEFFAKPPEKILDLGSGVGANTRPMIKEGSHVTAIDSSRELLEIFLSHCKTEARPSKSYRLRRGDITTMSSYGEGFNLVVAVDVLPYVPPKNLRSTMQKIHSCLADNGILIGTIFTINKDAPAPAPACAIMGKIGAHFYSGGVEFAAQLLKESGFRPIILEIREGSPGIGFKALKI